MVQGGPSHESSLLLTLEEISRLVSHSHDPAETLGNIVRLIQARFHTDVCSVYLLEAERGELVLGATVGLRADSVGRVRMCLDEGLTGLVAEKLVPVMVSDAGQHPRFKYFPEAGEDPYHSFLGVPLVEGGALQGVLVVQTAEPRAFSPSETRMLVTAAAQLAPLVSGARLLERITAIVPEESVGPALLHGSALSPGIGVGEAYVVDDFAGWQGVTHAGSADPAAESARLEKARDAARDEITSLSQHISALVGQDHGAILQAQLMLLQDRTIEQDITHCLAGGASAEGALLQVLERCVAAFRGLSTPFWQERVSDVKDVFRRVLWHLRPSSSPALGSTRLVLVAAEASVLDLFSVDPDLLAAVAVERGGSQGHAAILARSLGVPMVGQVSELLRRTAPGRRLLVDGDQGLVVFDPAPETVPTTSIQITSAALPTPAEEAALPDHPRVEVNINLLCEAASAEAQRAAGVGLYRSEFLFLARRTLPTEEEQFETYSRLLELLGGRPVSIRTFDLRPDKLAHGERLASSVAGPLDMRRMLQSPPLQKLFKDQVRAILRAAASGPARILVPLVTRTEQLDFATATIAEARAELQREGLDFGERVPLGVMIEVAAAALLAEDWAGAVDFFAIGTNDLAASALGLDRDDSAGYSDADPLHPGVLRLIHQIVQAAHAAGRPVTVCGEMAADPEGTLALAALQVDSLSVAVSRLGSTRAALARSPGEELIGLAPRLLRLRSAEQVRGVLRSLGMIPSGSATTPGR
jgi:phosphotransferase system enzyme I (PtsP)